MPPDGRRLFYLSTSADGDFALATAYARTMQPYTAAGTNSA